MNLIQIIRTLLIKLILLLCLVVFSSSQAYALEQEVPQRIIIPSASINLPIESAKIAYNTWEVSDTTASFGEGSALPGSIGNTVIFAHAREGLFGSLDKASEGELIYVFTNHDWFAYKISDSLIVPPTQVDVIQQSHGSELTLFTCIGPGDSHRLVLKAQLVH